jgi:1,4-alpha-glucan branching enzyme
MTGKKETGKDIRAIKIVKEKVIFEFSASEAREVCLAGDFNCWDIHTNPMKKDRSGLWKVTLPLMPGRYEYRFIADGQWEDDPSCSCCVPNQFGSLNCIKMVE